MLKPQKTTIIAGPCLAESFAMLEDTYLHLSELTRRDGCEFIFKASFDKANRSSLRSFRSQGIAIVLQWFSDIKAKYPNCVLTTDVHETIQVHNVSQVVDIAQIPAFLCRQSDLIEACAQSFAAVTVKKGQFLMPQATRHIAEKVNQIAPGKPMALIERGSTFGYGDLVVDMRSFKIMAEYTPKVIFDITHSLQQPGAQEVTRGLRHMAPPLARAAAASGYVNGFFLEVHPKPTDALSDRETQLDFGQASRLIPQLIDITQAACEWRSIDHHYSYEDTP